MSKLSFLATLLASAAVGIQAQAPAQAELCSCSPTVFNFILDFSNGCTVNDIKGNPGVETSLCFQEEVPAVPGQPPSSSDPARRALQNPTDDDPVVEVVNAQFLEFDTKGDLTVINQDNTYNSTTLKDGAAMQFYSVSSMLDTSVPLADQMEKPALVPGGASLILYGKTASGKVIRNRFFWLYNMECGRDTNPVQVGDQIGWVKVVSMHIIIFSFVIFYILSKLSLSSQTMISFNNNQLNFFISLLSPLFRNLTSVEHGPHSALHYLPAHRPSHHEQMNLHSLPLRLPL